MPVVPRVTDQSVDLRALPNAMQSAQGATPDAFGAANAQQLGRLANVTGQVAQRMQDREDADNLFRAETALATDYLQFEREELGRQGVDAKGAAERTSKWWGEAEQKYSQGLTSEKQQRLFDQSRQRRQLASTESLMRHEQAQLNRSLQESALASIQTAVDTAIGDPTPDRIALARQEVRQKVAVVGAIRGDSPERIAASEAEHLTRLHNGVVMSTIDRDPDAAKAYYYTHKKEIAGPQRAVIEKALDHGGRLAKAQEAADEIMAKGGSLSEMLTHVQKTYQGEDEKAITHEVTARTAVRQADMKRGEQAAYETGLLAVVQGKKVPAAVWSSMDDGHKAAILEHQRAAAKRNAAEGAGKKIKTDRETYISLRNMERDDPKAFAALDVRRYADKLDDGDLDRVLSLQTQYKTPKPDKAIKDVSTITQDVSSYSSKIAAGNSKEDKLIRDEFEIAARDAIDAEQKTKGKELDFKERQALLDRLVIDGEVLSGSWYKPDKDKRYFQVKPGEREKFAPKVPDDDRKQIEEALKAKGRPVNDESVRALYMRSKGLQ